MTIPMTLRRDRADSTLRQRRLTPGFTLMEILIAIALIVIIVTVAVTNLNGVLDSGKISAAQLFVTQEIDTALMQYKLAMGHYPSTQDGLQSLITCPSDEPAASWRGPYLKVDQVPLDPWKNPYQYAYPSTHSTTGGKYDCWSNGPDGQPGTADDVGNWSPPQ